MEIQKLLVNSEIAKAYLTKNTKKRKPNKAQIIRLSNKIKKGIWKEDTAEMIKISKNGNILDGQHRLMAVIDANVSIYFHFALGLEEEVFSVLDTGSLRNASDSFFISGVKNSNTIPSIITLNNSLKKGNKDLHIGKDKKLSNNELLDIYNENNIFWDDIATKTMRYYQSFSKILSPQIIGGFYSVVKEISTDKSDKFMEEFCTGMDISNYSINLLRNAFIKDKMSNRKMQIDMKLALIIKAWNFYNKGVNTKVLKWDSNIEKFPKIDILI